MSSPPRVGSDGNLSRRRFLAASAALPLAAQGLGRAAQSAAERPPNILFVLSDQHRADRAGFAGDPLASTPSLDALAAQGARFTAQYCQSPLCMSSRQSLLTGRYVHHHGSYRNWQLPSEPQRTLAHAFADAGYATALVGKDHCNATGFAHVETHTDLFDDFLTQHADGVLAGEGSYEKRKDDPDGDFVGSMNPDYAPAGPEGRPVFFLEDEITERALRFLRGVPQEQPFFLWASFLSPHPPLFPPPEYLARYAEADVPLAGSMTVAEEGLFQVYVERRRALGMDRVDADALRNITRAYYASLTYADACIGRLLAGLDELGLGTETLVVYTSDHGEMLGQHGLLQKQTLYEGAVRVPTLMRWPQRIPAGLRVDAVSEHVDLSATLLDLAGVEAGMPLDGRSLRGLLSPAGDATWDDLALSEMLTDGARRPGDLDPSGAPAGLCWMLRAGRYKLIWHVGAESALFDLEADPDERVDLSRDLRHAERLAELRARLLRFAPEEWTVQKTGSREGRPNQGRTDRRKRPGDGDDEDR